MEGMPRICIEIDEDLLAKVAEELETSTVQETVTTAIREVYGAKKRIELIAGVSRPGFAEALRAMERADKVLVDRNAGESD